MAQNKAMHERTGGGIGDGNGLSWSITYANAINSLEFVVSEEDKTTLQELAKQVAERANHPCQQEKKQRWKKHHSLEITQPLIFCDPEAAWYEIIPAVSLKCCSPLARMWEMKLRKEIFWADNIKDDRVVEPAFTVHHVSTKTSRGLETQIIGGGDGNAYTWESPLKDGYEALDELKYSSIVVDTKRTNELLSLAHDVFDGILTVRLEGIWWWTLGMSSDLILLRGFENILMDFYDYPDEVHALMAFLRDENLAMLDFLESENLLSLNNGGDFHGTGGYGWTDELPSSGFDGSHVKTTDMWGFCESQETVGVSPEIFEEFIFPYQNEILQRFGLNIYGCCEPLDTRWDVVKKIPRLRKVTVSPWSNNKTMAEHLRSDYVYCKKVNPALIAVSNVDEDAVRKELRDVFSATKKHRCPTEVLMRDVMTLANKAQNAVRWVQIAREEAER